MREIKLKAWDKERHKFIPFVARAENGDLLQINGGWINTERIEWILYTGLSDKNSVEIFEGDILKYTYPAGYALCEVRFGKWDNGETYEDYEGGYGWFIKEYAHYKFKDSNRETIEVRLSGITGYPLNQHKHEVIGNIKENPDLLEV